MNIHSLLYKVTGRMTKKQIVRTAETIGTDLIARAQKNGDVLVEDVQEVFASHMGKRAVNRIIISGKLAKFKEFLGKHLGMSEDLAEFYYNNSKAARDIVKKSQQFPA